MRRLFTTAITVLCVTLAGCETAPVTGREQLILLSEEQASKLGIEAYRQIRREKTIADDPRLSERVRRVGADIARVSANPDFDWEFTLFEDETPNAFALPGGKVGVYTGLFKVVENDAQLAAVLAHEIAHVAARHSAERLSSQVLIEAGLTGAGAVTGSQDLVRATALAATLGISLPFSRSQEAEADTIGLQYMANAGYDPRAAIEVWRNFQAFGGDRPPEFLSTHPHPETRIERMREQLPRALEIYRQRQGVPPRTSPY